MSPDGTGGGSCWWTEGRPVWRVDGNLPLVVFVESCQPCGPPSVREWGPLELGVHLLHTG